MTQQIDPRGPQFTAAVTAVVLAVVLVTAPSAFATALLAVQAALFGLGAALGVQRTPHAWVFRTLIRPRLAPTEDWEDPAPPRFAQAVGLRLRRGRPGRLRRRPDRPRPGRDRVRPGRGPAQRRLPLLPGLRDVPAHPSGRRFGDRRHDIVTTN